jgi:SAM-dependent methyltransferase
MRTIKEIIRHILLVSGMNRIAIRIRRALGLDVGHLLLNTSSERFNYIYDHSFWTFGDPDKPRSGWGSSISSTEQIRLQIPKILDQLNATSILDVGCGDYTWMQNVSLRQRYIGVDIVESVIENNIANFSNDNVSFFCLDATSTELPRCDVVLCREVLFHLSFADIVKLLANIRTSGAKHLLATNDTLSNFNADIISGDFRVLNLKAPPFRFPEPLFSIPDDKVYSGRSLNCWRIESLPSSFMRREKVSLSR